MQYGFFIAEFNFLINSTYNNQMHNHKVLKNDDRVNQR
jgi:hypothetical protein